MRCGRMVKSQGTIQVRLHSLEIPKDALFLFLVMYSTAEVRIAHLVDPDIPKPTVAVFRTSNISRGRTD